MTKPPKAKKTNRNQPVVFDETLSATLPAPSALPAASVRPRQGFRTARIILGAIWVMAAICAGIGVGLILKEAAGPTAFDPGTPIATADLTVTSAAAVSDTAPTIVLAHPAAAPDLAVTTGQSVTQAQAGSITATVSLAAYQPAAGTVVLQPGYAQYSRTQGNIGTTPAR